MIDLLELLSKKYRESELGHLYILRTSLEYREATKFLHQWIHKFLKTALEQEQCKVSLADHPDFLFINQDSEDQYKLKDPMISQFHRFLSYRPFHLKHRFIVIEKSHLIGKQLGNKFLLSFESPPANTTIFLLDSLGKELLQTIQSRAITLNISTSQKEEDMVPENISGPTQYLSYRMNKTDLDFSDVLAVFNEDSLANLSEITNILKKSKSKTLDFLDFLLDYERLYGSDFTKKQNLLEQIKWFQNSATYSNSAAERISSVLYCFANGHIVPK